MALVSEEWKPRLPVPIVIGSGGNALIQILIISFSVFPRLNDTVGQAWQKTQNEALPFFHEVYYQTSNFLSSTVAYAINPSSLPTKPSFSVVVAFMEISFSVISAMAAISFCICSA